MVGNIIFVLLVYVLSSPVIVFSLLGADIINKSRVYRIYRPYLLIFRFAVPILGLLLAVWLAQVLKFIARLGLT